MQQNNFTNAILLQHNFINEDGISDILLNSTFVKDGKTVNQGDKRVCKIYQPPKQRELANYIHKFLVDLNVVDEVITISTKEAKERSLRLAKENGLFVGISAGANVLASERWIEQNNPDGLVVTILCDRGERYFSCL